MNIITVKEVLLAAAAQLGIYDGVKAYLDGSSQEAAAETEALLRCFNLVENELALDYLPLYVEETVETTTGTVYYKELSRSAVRVVKVTDEWDNAAEFKLFPEYLKTQGGKIKIRYAYIPEKKELDDECDCASQVSARMMSYGVAAEYCLASGLFEDGAIWDKKYKEAIEAAYRSKPCRVMQSRRWV